MELSQRGSFTVVIANDDQDGRAALELARAWHRDGLLCDFAWVSPSQVLAAPHGPTLVKTLVVATGQESELLGLLGVRPRALVRIVVLHMLTHEDSNAVPLAHACNEVGDLVKRAMPVQLSSHGDPGTKLLRINLMVP